jgi:hypothetical protein
MLPTRFALLVGLLNLLWACAIGLFIGFVSSRVMRLAWNWRIAALDVLVACVCSLAVILVFVAVSFSRENFEPGLKWMFIAAIAGVVARAIVRWGTSTVH